MTTRVVLQIALGGEPPREIKLFGAGRNATTKGDFVFDDKAAESVMARFRDHGLDKLPFDFDHGMFASEVTSENRKAAGWFVPEIRNGELWATNIEWTPLAAQMLRDKEFRFFSPAFDSDNRSGRILRLWNVALTNLPATKGQMPLVANEGEVPAILLGDRLARFVKRQMEQKGVTVAELGRAAGIAEGTVRAIISGEIVRPPDGRLEGFARALGVSADRLKSLANQDAGRTEASDDGIPELLGERLGAFLRRALDRKDVSRERLASAAGIEKSTIDAIIQGAIIRPPDGRLRAIARVLDVSFERLKGLAERDKETAPPRENHNNAHSGTNEGTRMQKLLTTLSASDEVEAIRVVDKMREDMKTRDEQIVQLTAHIATLETEKVEAAKTSLIDQLTEDGKAPPALRPFLETLSVEQIEQFAEKMPGASAPAQPPSGDEKVVRLSDWDRRILKSSGISEEQFIEERKRELSAKKEA